jgi:RES domain-containing protein
MSRRIFRVCRSIHASLDGEGAKRVGGRWNSPGRAVVYMAETVSLAVLENLVHMTKQDFPTGYILLAAVVPEHLRVLRAEDLPV